MERNGHLYNFTYLYKLDMIAIATVVYTSIRFCITYILKNDFFICNIVVNE